MNEGIGEVLREAFEAQLDLLGETFVVHDNFGTAEARSFEVVGLKGKDERGSTQVFQFLDPVDVKLGSIIQVKGARDFWKVIDTEDVVSYGTFVKFKIFVEKVNVSGQPTRTAVKGGDTFNLQGSHSRINIHSQDNSVNVSRHVTENVFADMRQVIQTSVQSDDERTQILSKLHELETAKGTSSFTLKYQEFIATAANHLSLLSPFIPALTEMLGG